jgi:hypothetical protein
MNGVMIVAYNGTNLRKRQICHNKTAIPEKSALGTSVFDVHAASPRPCFLESEVNLYDRRLFSGLSDKAPVFYSCRCSLCTQQLCTRSLCTHYLSILHPVSPIVVTRAVDTGCRYNGFHHQRVGRSPKYGWIGSHRVILGDTRT